jgi:DNA modification methylase
MPRRYPYCPMDPRRTDSTNGDNMADLDEPQPPEELQEALDDPISALPVRMTEAQVEEVTRLLRAGRRLPPHLFPHLFEVPREYELSYRGKARRVDVVADTMAVPLQPARTFGDPEDGWSNMLVLGDNLQVLRQLLNLKAAGRLRNPDGSDGVRTCYIDPPFASQQEFAGNRNERAYTDRVAGAEFVEHLRRRLILIRELLTPDGSLFVHLDTRKVHYIKVILDELFGESNFRNELIWKRTSAHSSANRFGPVHDTLLFYSRSDRYLWNQHFDEYGDRYLAEFYTHTDPDGRSWRRSDLTAAGVRHGATGQVWRGIDITAKGRHWAYPPSELERMDALGRIHWPKKKGGMPMLKRYFDTQKGVPVQDVWTDIRPIHNLGAERVGYPTQKPVELVQRLIAATSNAGDIVLDAFVGSGTTLIAAQTIDEPRRWIGIDSGKFAIYVSQAKLLRLAGKRAPEHAFSLFNAGLYDYKALRELPWDQYVPFVLELFQCRKYDQNIGGVQFQGYIGDDPVLVYDFKQHPDGRIGQEFVEDLSNVCRSRLGDRCFIIAPTTAVEPYEDYLTVGAHGTVEALQILF